VVVSVLISSSSHWKEFNVNRRRIREMERRGEALNALFIYAAYVLA
jgi:hypothetical protein